MNYTLACQFALLMLITYFMRNYAILVERDEPEDRKLTQSKGYIAALVIMFFAAHTLLLFCGSYSEIVLLLRGV